MQRARQSQYSADESTVTEFRLVAEENLVAGDSGVVEERLVAQPNIFPAEHVVWGPIASTDLRRLLRPRAARRALGSRSPRRAARRAAARAAARAAPAPPGPEPDPRPRASSGGARRDGGAS